MIYLLIKFVFVLFVALLSGLGLRLLLGDKTRSVGDDFTENIVNGLGAISIYAGVCSLFVPLGLYLLLPLFMSLVSTELRTRLRQTWQSYYIALTLMPYARVFWAAGLSFVLMILYLSAGQSITGDEGAYHAQVIHLAERYPVIKGLGNVGIKLGFNSHWHLLAALFGGRSLLGYAENHINGALTVAFMIYALGAALSICKGHHERSNYMRILSLPIVFIPTLLPYYLIDASADLAALYWTIFIFVEWYRKYEEGSFGIWNHRSFSILLASTVLVTFKMSALVSAIPALYCALPLLRKPLRFRALALSGVLVMAAGASWLGRNILLTGYPLYPSHTLPVAVDWRMPERDVLHVQRLIKDWAVTLYANERTKISQDDFWQSRRVWFFHNLRTYDRIIVIIGLFSALILLIMNTLRRRYELLLLWGTALAGIVFWWVSAPDPRFGYAYLLMPVVALSAERLCTRAAVWALMAAGLMCLSTAGVLYERWLKAFVQRGEFAASDTAMFWLLPSRYPQGQIENFVLRDGNTVKRSLRSQNCWDEYPCLYEADTLLRFRGADISEGFCKQQR